MLIFQAIEDLEDKIIALKAFVDDHLPKDHGLVVENRKEAVKLVRLKVIFSLKIRFSVFFLFEIRFLGGRYYYGI